MLWPDVFLIGPMPSGLPPDLVKAAAVASGGPGAALDAGSALERHLIWNRHDSSIHVAASGFHRDVPGYGVRFHRRLEIDATIIDGVPTRMPLDALVAAAASLSRHQAASVIERGEYRGLFTLDDVATACDRRRGTRGITTLRRAVELRERRSVGTKSRSEDRLVPFVSKEFGEPVVNVRGSAGLLGYEPDFCWPDRRWIVEVDGGHHLEDSVQLALDVERDAILRAAGWTIVRIPWRMALYRPHVAMRQIVCAFHDGARSIAPSGPRTGR